MTTASLCCGEQIPLLAEVVTKRWESADVATLGLRLAEPAGTLPGPQPGQFNMLYPFGVGEAAISFSEIPPEPHLMVHTVRAAGATSRALTQLKRGDLLGLRGPFGCGWPLEAIPPGGNIIAMAGGLGLAPLGPLLHAIATNRPRYGSVALLYGSRSPESLIFQHQLEQWPQQSAIDVRITVDSAGGGWRGNVGLVTALLDELTIDAANTIAFICGPEVMMRHSAESLTALGLASSRIWLSLERNMKCAIGHCGHCQFGADFVCRDGPVLPYGRIRRRLFTKAL
ncbi:MAG: FAD/NAD(P)-binding protein [Candidatus Competibacterales bacterium]